MNAKEKQIIFDKTEIMNSNKAKTQRKAFVGNKNLFRFSILRKETDYLNPHQITERNDDCINEITNKISKIISQEKLILRKKRKLLKK